MAQTPKHDCYVNKDTTMTLHIPPERKLPPPYRSFQENLNPLQVHRGEYVYVLHYTNIVIFCIIRLPHT